MRIALIVSFCVLFSCKGKVNQKDILTSIQIETVHQQFNSDANVKPATTKTYHLLNEEEYVMNLFSLKDGSYYAQRYLKKNIVEVGASEIILVKIVDDSKRRTVFPTIQHFESLFISQGYELSSKKAIAQGEWEYSFIYKRGK